jgi:4'-phosphopantetheinyl transferase
MTSDEIHLIVLETSSGTREDARALLRKALALRLGVGEDLIVLEKGPHGKPFLGGEFRGSDLAFNLSHSGNKVAVAIGRGRNLGVDIERLRPLDHEALASRYFTAEEAAVFRAARPEDREETFFHYWTAKEAYLKARGIGIGQGLKDHRFSDLGISPPRLLWTAGGESASAWNFYRFRSAGGYLGTLAYAGDLAKVREFDRL